VTTSKSIRDAVRNVLDYLTDADLILSSNDVSIRESQHLTRISWHGHNPAADFLISREYGTVDQYFHWMVNGIYSVILFDASLLQITYDLAGDAIVGHRLTYVPCPFMVDLSLLTDGAAPVADVVGLYDRLSDVALRSPIRFDYDVKSAKRNHPAAHLTINSADCRIACVAAMHPLRFADFIFRHFYPRLWGLHSGFFAAAAWQHLGKLSLSDGDRISPHVMWNIHATAAEVMSAQRGT